MRIGMERFARAYRRWRMGRIRKRAERDREVFFDKYERDGAYHWDFYHGGRSPYYRALVDCACGMVAAGSDVLDLGCGDGLVADVLAQSRGCRVLGVDLHPLAISLAREKDRSGNRFEVGSVYDIRHRASFDAAVALEVFEHLRQPERMLAAARRALRAGGTLIVSTPVADPSRPLSRYHAREYTRDEFAGALGALFDVVEERTVCDPTGREATMVCRCVARRGKGQEGRAEGAEGRAEREEGRGRGAVGKDGEP